MKKYLLLLGSLMLSMSMNAQMYLGGTFSFVSEEVPSNDGKTTATSFTFAPDFGYALTDMWSVGLELEYTTGDLFTAKAGKYNLFYDANTGSRLNKRITTFGVAPYVRCKFIRKNLVDVFVDGGVGYVNVNNGTNNASVFTLAFQPGILLNVTKHLSFVTSLGTVAFATSTTDEAGSPTYNNFLFGLSSLKEMEFGLFYNF